MKKNIKNVFIVVVLIISLVISLFNTIKISNIILEFNDLFIKRLFPVSFVFFTISNLLIEYNFFFIFKEFFHIDSIYLYVFIISLFSGFPNGAVVIKDLLDKGYIDEGIANKMIMFCHFPNPLFVINSVSLIINYKISIFILISIIMSNLIIFIFIYKEKTNIYIDFSNTDKFSNCLTRSILKSFKTLIMIYGISLVFYIISYFISNLFVDNVYIYVFINGLFDLTKGCFYSSLINNDYIKGLYILFFIVFGSISIHMQIKSILEDTSISYKNFIIGRIIGVIISTIIILLCFKLFLTKPLGSLQLGLSYLISSL